MQVVLAASAAVLTVALVVLIGYAIRALNQLTLTVRRLDATLERSSHTLDRVDGVLDSLRARLAELERIAGTVNAAHDLVTELGSGLARRARGPAGSAVAVAVAALKGVETFLNYRRRAPEGDGHE
ncbi:MAG TPA: DUF948 domain-containing protein [Candidatus Saccharimonadales bacterium]|nr:DUF948 domain-containing protein [Candidatus Saccharimonadales bacterium]